MGGQRLRRCLAAAFSSVAVRGYAEYCEGPPLRRALLSYVAWPLAPPPPLRDRSMFSNRGIAQEIPRALNELGYSVDIISYEDRAWVPRRRYDLFIGHGGLNFSRLCGLLPEGCPRVYFATGLYWREANARVERRAAEMEKRTGRLVPRRRLVESDEEGAYRDSDGVICLGGNRAAETFSGPRPVAGIENAVYPPEETGAAGLFETRRRSFLFFSGWGNVLKGLDLVIEAFADSDLQLHVCQRMEPEFLCAYAGLLAASPNIQMHGFVGVGSRKFRALISDCAWVISATCSEGQPGSVLECMARGLVPVVPDAANIDVGDWGIRLEPCVPGRIRDAACEASRMSEAEYKLRASAARSAIVRRHTVVEFRSQFKRALQHILGRRA